MNLGAESEILEFKLSTSEKREACESIIAMLNKHGYGEVYFGVLDNGEVKGQIISDSTIKDLSETIYRDIEPRIIPTIEVLNIDNVNILKVSFYGSNKPYSAYGKFLIRVGTQNRKMSRDELIRLVQENDYSSDWEKETNNSTLDDIDDNSLFSFYKEAINCGRLIMEEYSKEGLLSILELYKYNTLNNAAIALFGKNANISLKIASFATDKKITFTDLKMFKGNIYTLIDEALVYVKNHIDWSIEIGKIKRIETPEIPLNALREIIINAFAHANYNCFPEIEINIFPSKITIINPGTFPMDLTPNDFIDKNLSSIKRNPLILEVLFRCKDVEKSGTGFKRMDEWCNKSNVKWSFLKSAYNFSFSFSRKNVQANVHPDVHPDSLNEIENIVFQAICENPKILKIEIAKLIGKSEKTVQRIVNNLTKLGYIIRVGNNQYGYWEVINKQ